MTLEETTPATDFVPGDLARFVDIASAVISPGGDALYYVANTRDGVTATTDTAIWSVDTSTGDVQLFSPTERAQSKPAISPDGSVLAFLEGKVGGMQVCVRSVSGGTTQTLSSFPRGTGAAGPQWSPDGRLLSVDATDKPPRDPALPYRVTRPVWRRDGLGLVEDKVSDLYVIPIAGGAPERVTADDGVVHYHRWSADGSQLLYITFAAPGSYDYEIKIVDYPSKTTHLVTRGPTSGLIYGAVTAAWTPDGRVVYPSPWTLNAEIDLMVFDPATGTHDSRAPSLGGQLFGTLHGGFDAPLFEPRIVVDPAGCQAYVAVQRGGTHGIYAVALSGDVAVERLTDDQASRTPVAFAGDTLLIGRTSYVSPANLYTVDVTSGKEAPLTRVNESWFTGAPFTVHRLNFDTEDGTEIEGWFLEPLVGSRPYPTVLHIHGGPFAGHGEIFNLDTCVLTAAGYGVLQINFRGGSGYGDDFSACLLGDWGRFDLEDLLHGVDVAVESGFTDTDRVASFGLSGGGYLTAWLLSHSDRFRAGVAECPVSDWNAMMASDIGPMVAKWMASEPGHGPASTEPYIRMSPSTYAADTSGPMLVIEHESDLRCPASQGDILYNELQLAGLPTEMLRLPGVPHVPFQAANLVAREGRAEALLDWLDTHVR
jgi:dipeptidyl aminopeptidase/acylaminoacyl peptidase